MIEAILKGKIWKMREISRILFERTYNGTNVWRPPNGRLRNVTHQRIGQRKTMNISEFITPDELTLLTGRPTGRSFRSTIKFYIFYSDRKGTPADYILLDIYPVFTASTLNIFTFHFDWHSKSASVQNITRIKTK